MHHEAKHALLVPPREVVLPLTLEPSPPALLEARMVGMSTPRCPTSEVGILGLSNLSRAASWTIAWSTLSVPFRTWGKRFCPSTVLKKRQGRPSGN